MNELINDGGDCRTAPATPGLLIIVNKVQEVLSGFDPSPPEVLSSINEKSQEQKT